MPVDYCSEKLHDYFVDRKFRSESGNARKFLECMTIDFASKVTFSKHLGNICNKNFVVVNGGGSSSYTGSSMPSCSSGGPAIASTSSSLLAPPPDPPCHLRDPSSRFESRFGLQILRSIKLSLSTLSYNAAIH